jgi:hypothetical protein
MMQARRYYRAKKFLTEGVIVAELSDVPDDIFSDSDDSVIINRERNCAPITNLQ